MLYLCNRKNKQALGLKKLYLFFAAFIAIHNASYRTTFD